MSHHCRRITSNGRTFIEHHPLCPGRFEEFLCLFRIFEGRDFDCSYDNPDEEDQ
jgi:hypothetical protein